MNWVKSVLLDIIAFIVIVAFAITSNEVILIIIWVYTGILLTGKILYFFVDFLQAKAQKTDVPDWFYHLNYVLSVAVLAFTGNYYITGAWLLVWILSVIPSIKKRKKTVSKS
ncbi:MAG: hypothetical protein ACMZ7B_13650 [Balneola sp.]